MLATRSSLIIVYWISLVRVSVALGSSAGFVLERDQKLMRRREGDFVTWIQRSVVRNHDRMLIAVFDVYRLPHEQLAVHAEDVGFGGIVRDCIGWQDDPVLPFLDGQ